MEKRKRGRPRLPTPDELTAIEASEAYKNLTQEEALSRHRLPSELTKHRILYRLHQEGRLVIENKEEGDARQAIPLWREKTKD